MSRGQVDRAGFPIIRLLGSLAFILLLSVTSVTNAMDQKAGKSVVGDPWCRLDDPGTSEEKRKGLKLGSRDLAKLPCPEHTDPQTRPDELILPMPCGRAMVFRKVSFQLRHVLDHREAYLGTVPEGAGGPVADVRRVAMSGPWSTFVAGSLTMAPTTRGAESSGIIRGFYIGKYEVSALQFTVYRNGLLVPNGANPDPESPLCQALVAEAQKYSGTRMLPATEVTWFEAVDFARTYSEWLIAFDRARIAAGKPPTALPWEESVPSFLRLPTAAEWEFAARAGDVSSATQSNQTYEVFVDGVRRLSTLEEVASMTTPQTPPPEGSQAHYLGRKLPNALGLYDMIGNIDEIVFDLFRPTRPDQLQGLEGGFVVKGGNALDSKEIVGVGARREVPFFTRDGPIRFRLTGFRLVLSAPFLVNKRDEKWQELAGNPTLDSQLKTAWTTLLDSATAPGGKERAEATQELERLRADSENLRLSTKELKAKLATVQAALDRSTAAINEREAQLLVERIRSVVLTASNINSVHRQIVAADSNMEKLKERVVKSSDAKEKELIENALKTLQSAREQLIRSNDANFRYYLETIRGLAQPKLTVIKSAAEQVQHQFLSEGNTVFDEFQRLTVDHIGSARDAHLVLTESTKAKWLKEIHEARRTRDAKRASD